MSEFNFKSQVCTDKVQSERLLALGLKKETRDAVLKKYIHNDKYCYKPVFDDIDDRLIDCNDLYPAWSLHRLIKMMPEYIVLSGQGHYISIREHCVKYVLDGYESNYMGVWSGYTLYDKLINCIEWLIKEGYFNKEYLV